VTGIAASGWTEDSQGVCGAAIGKGCSYQRFRISRNIWKLSEQQEFEEKKKFGRIELSKMVVLPKNPEHDQLSIIQLMLVKQQ